MMSEHAPRARRHFTLAQAALSTLLVAGSLLISQPAQAQSGLGLLGQAALANQFGGGLHGALTANALSGNGGFGGGFGGNNLLNTLALSSALGSGGSSGTMSSNLLLSSSLRSSGSSSRSLSSFLGNSSYFFSGVVPPVGSTNLSSLQSLFSGVVAPPRPASVLPLVPSGSLGGGLFGGLYAGSRQLTTVPVASPNELKDDSVIPQESAEGDVEPSGEEDIEDNHFDVEDADEDTNDSLRAS